MAWRIWQTIVKGVRSLSRVEKGWHSPQKSSESCLTIQAYARLCVRQSLLFVSSRTHTRAEGGDVNPARLPKFNAPLVFGRRVSATARASADAALAPRIRFLLLYFSLGTFYPPRSPSYSMLPSRLVARGSRFIQTTRSFTSDWLAILSHLSARVPLFLVTVCHVRGDISPSPRFIAKLPFSLSVASLESFFAVR